MKHRLTRVSLQFTLAALILACLWIRDQAPPPPHTALPEVSSVAFESPHGFDAVEPIPTVPQWPMTRWATRDLDGVFAIDSAGMEFPYPSLIRLEPLKLDATYSFNPDRPAVLEKKPWAFPIAFFLNFKLDLKLDLESILTLNLLSGREHPKTDFGTIQNQTSGFYLDLPGLPEHRVRPFGLDIFLSDRYWLGIDMQYEERDPDRPAGEAKTLLDVMKTDIKLNYSF